MGVATGRGPAECRTEPPRVHGTPVRGRQPYKHQETKVGLAKKGPARSVWGLF